MSTPSRVLTAARTLTAVKGKALSFDGVDDYVDCGNDVIDATGTITFECWFKSNDRSATQGIASIVNTGYDYNTGKNNLVVGIYSSRIQATAAGSLKSTRWSSVLQSNTWYHLVVIKVPGDIDKIYINGVEDTHSASVYWGGDVSTVIGKVDVAIDRYLNGTIALVRIYERALREEEVLYNKEHPYNPILHGCVLWLGHDSIDEGAGKWYDKSGQNNDGVIYGATAVEMNKLAGRVLSV